MSKKLLQQPALCPPGSSVFPRSVTATACCSFGHLPEQTSLHPSRPSLLRLLLSSSSLCSIFSQMRCLYLPLQLPSFSSEHTVVRFCLHSIETTLVNHLDLCCQTTWPCSAFVLGPCGSLSLGALAAPPQHPCWIMSS